MVNLWVFIITIISILLIIYHHVGYPLLLKWLAVRSHISNEHKKSKPAQIKKRDLPKIAVLIPAYNEAKWIADKIRNLSTLNYPSDKFHVFLGCDGCTDETAQIARETIDEIWNQSLCISIIEYKKNEGKVATINKLIPMVKEEIVALSDVSALISIDAFLLAAEHFKDPNIGIVNSHYTLLHPNPGESKYWNYQSKIKTYEAQLNTLLGAHGALYFFKLNLFTPLQKDTINDDFMIPMNILAKGYRPISDDNILSLEMEPTNLTQDFKRRLRIGAGNYQQLIRLKSLLNPKYGSTAFAFASSKALRVFIPFLMIIACLGSLYLALFHWFFILISAGQWMIYLSILVFSITKNVPKHPLVQSVHYLVVGHSANFLGTLRYIVK